ncbi:MAG: 6-phosphogluconolactonase [Deltaproteobacteria bacterium]|nr:6-phosphogluconolactonase [Deltaproteobacteria bacterium]
MPLKVIICSDFDHVSEVAGRIVLSHIKNKLKSDDRFVIGLATGNSPTGMYRHLAKAANTGEFDSSKIISFNLDEYIGLPGENPQQRALHHESYCYFMIQELFGLLDKKFIETNVPWGTLIDQNRLISELDANPGDWHELGSDKGKAIVIRKEAESEYLRWVKKETQDAYVEKIARSGGIDLQIIGAGGRGHVAFHESGIPFEKNRMLLVRLDDNTVLNAVEDGHFPSTEQSPKYALSMGAEQVYKAGTVILLANGTRKSDPVAESLLGEPTPHIPISYGQIHARNGGLMIYIIDKMAATALLKSVSGIDERRILIEDISDQSASIKAEEIFF